MLLILRTLAVSLVIAVTFVAGACSDDAPAPADSVPSAGHAATGVVPGSYEDWCAEHSLPESRCTRCDPSLVAAFKATGDWCAEHGLPESQCVTCDPGRAAVRPPKPEAR